MQILSDTTKINTIYDDIFINKISFPWLPWVGIDFDDSDSKIIILGESTYNWNPDDPRIQERINKNNHLRILHQNHAINLNRKSKYVRNIERAIFQVKNPSDHNKLKFWNSVVYHNLVLKVMPTIKSRPTYSDYKNGWESYLKLINTIKSKECLVYGLESKKYNSLIELLKENNIAYEYRKLSIKVGRSYPRIIVLKDIPHKILFIRHPSSHFSWKKWGEVIKENLNIYIDK